MKILFCANIYESGIVGPARFAEMLMKINDVFPGQHEVRILTADVSVEKHRVYKMTFSMPRLLRFFEFFFRSLSFYRGIKSIRKSYDFDIVLFGNAMYGFIAKKRMPDILMGGMVNDDHTLVVTLKNFLFYAGGKSLLLLKYIEKFSSKQLDFIITCSDYLKETLVKHYELNPQRIFRLYQAVDVFSLSFEVPKVPSSIVKILFVKHRYDIGRIKDLARALRLLSDFNFEVTVVGPPIRSKREILDYFKQMSHVNVLFLGPIPQHIVHEEMCKNDILCIPSILEAQGLANVEGIAHGIAVVTSNAGGIPEVMNHGSNGWMCEPMNPESLASALRKCLNTSNMERKAVALRARKFAEDNFGYSVCIKNLLSLLDDRMVAFYKPHHGQPNKS